ncbi:MAG TPA: NAD-dependent epimerase/dehydratase family protein [Ilumatobacter sp.]|nr:NAD-dependent epimerase/dehydratase family protein [Ilumatobacter sp.]
MTGATSMIGRRFVERLLLRGDQPICLQRHAADVDAAQVLGDIRDAAIVQAAAKSCEAAVHLAAKVGVVGTWNDYRSVNVDGTAHLIAAARHHDLRTVVHVSSPSVAHVGDPIAGGLAEPAETGRRGAWYPESKALAERAALSANHESMAVIAIRPHLVWGPGDQQLVGRIVERARTGRLALVNGGRALVDTTYIENAVDALIAALDRAQPGAPCAGKAYVVTNGEPRTIRELVHGICQAAGLTVKHRSSPIGIAAPVGGIIERIWERTNRTSDPPITRFLAEQLGTSHWFDPRPAAEDLGYHPAISIDEGLARLAAWNASQR